MVRQYPLDENRKKMFLDHLREHGLVIAACRHASPKSKDGAKVTFYQERAKNPEFAQQWEDALEESEDNLLMELKRRGIDGVEEDVYGNLGDKQGTGVVGKKKVYSDKMAELYARVRSARVRQGLANRVELQATMNHKQELDLSNLSIEKQELLTRLLEE